MIFLKKLVFSFFTKPASAVERFISPYCVIRISWTHPTNTQSILVSGTSTLGTVLYSNQKWHVFARVDELMHFRLSFVSKKDAMVELEKRFREMIEGCCADGKVRVLLHQTEEPQDYDACI